MLEACKVQYGTLVPQGDNANITVQKTDWEAYISLLASEILREQSPQKLLAAREKLYELLVNCIPADVIITTLALELCKFLDDCVKHEVIEWAAIYEHRICQGSKDIFHLEAFIAKFMAIYKRYLNDLFG
jgi:replication factor C subunit 3/5